MSYSFGMYFLPVKSFDEALIKAHNFTVICSSDKNIQKLLEDEKYYFPSFKTYPKTDKEKSIARYADDFFVDYVTNLKFVYFHNAKLLALVGYDYPEAKDFFKCNICFQNSCDQDYKKEEWGGIRYFEKIWDKCAIVSAKKILKLLNKMHEYEAYTLQEIKDGLDYHRRSLAYDEIYQKLSLNEWLYGHENKNFTRFTLSLLTTQEKRFQMQRYAKYSILYDIYKENG